IEPDIIQMYSSCPPPLDNGAEEYDDNDSFGEILESCNGEKPPCLEVLTNGFTGLATVNPQGTDDLDNVADSKGQKPISTECNFHSAPSPAAEGIANFTTFSKKEWIQLEEIGCAVLHDRDTLTIQENYKINGVNEVNSLKEVSLGRSFDDKGDTDGEDTCVSEISIVSNRGFSVEKQGLPTLQSKWWSLVDSADYSEFIMRQQCRTMGELDLFSAKCADLGMDSMKTSDADEIDSSKEERKFTNSQSLSTDSTEDNVLYDPVSVKNGESSDDFVTCNDTNEDDFGDFGTASGTTSPLITGTQDSMSDVTFEESLQHFPHVSKPSDDFGEFGDTNATSCQDEMLFTESDLKHTSVPLSEECHMARKSSETGTEPVSKLINGKDSEFGDFDYVPNIENDCNAFQDSHDFAGFSSAGPSQVVYWNAFKVEQKDGCSWDDFGHQ
ncbi:Aftiphilin, partial [Heterocephalus glaber]